jgi:hypothetical protein
VPFGTINRILQSNDGIKVTFQECYSWEDHMSMMLRRLAVVWAVVLCMTFLAACQSETPIKPGKSGEEKDEPAEAADSKLKELAIQYEGKSLQISGDADEKLLESIFGAAEDKKTHTYTAEDNMDPHIGKTTNEYSFPGIVIKTINTLGDKSRFYVYQMEIYDPRYTTPRSIKVGDSLDKLKEKYPEANPVSDSDDGGYYLYNPVDHFDAMGFTIADGKISSIKIYTLLE